MPDGSGNLEAARKLVPHACHIRYNDLTRFVFLRKADRYDELASLMGFVPQMDYQKALRRVQGSLERDVEHAGELQADAEERFKQHFNLDDPDVDSGLVKLAEICTSHGIETEPILEKVKAASLRLNQIVASDPNAKTLADLVALISATTGCFVAKELSGQVTQLRAAVGLLKAKQQEHLKTQLLIPLFEAADRILAKTEPTGACPLCGKTFDGDLKQHVSAELEKMRHLAELVQQLADAKQTLQTALLRKRELVGAFEKSLGQTQPDVSKEKLVKFKDASRLIDSVALRIGGLLIFDTTALTDELVEKLRAEQNSFDASLLAFRYQKASLLREARKRKRQLPKEASRTQLVNEAQFAAKGLALIQEARGKCATVERLQKTLRDFRLIVDGLVDKCLGDVDARFDAISDKVKLLFGILEQGSCGLLNFA